MEEAILKVNQGDRYFDEQLFKANPEKQAKRPEHFIPRLTNREKEVLVLISREYTSIEIGSELHISLGTVETHRRNLIAKLNVKNTAGLVRKAMEYKLI